ncbi:hypothetical protein ARZXY2_4603 (plasmid) [Arthrobacter sp. ZXY-2]|nr:hypothetical protein ARZXY2_4603 [Arthrobacter sp. ZXY-2]
MSWGDEPGGIPLQPDPCRRQLLWCLPIGGAGPQPEAGSFGIPFWDPRNKTRCDASHCQEVWYTRFENGLRQSAEVRPPSEDDS